MAALVALTQAQLAAQLTKADALTAAALPLAGNQSSPNQPVLPRVAESSVAKAVIPGGLAAAVLSLIPGFAAYKAGADANQGTPEHHGWLSRR